MAKPDSTELAEMLLVSAGGHACAIPVQHVRETMRALPIAAVADVPPFVLGLAVIRGKPTPVIDLNALVANEAARPTHQRFVTLALDGRSVALAVDHITGVRRVDTAQLGALPPLLQGANTERVASIGAADAHVLMVLNSARLVPEAVWSTLAVRA
jgi:purine-binding chemotaxis protein CheW